MKLEIEKKDLLSLIGKTQNIVEKRNTMPILVNVLLEASGDQLKVFATDLEVSLTDEVSAKISQEGKIAVSAKKLFEITKELADGKLRLVKKENNWLNIEQGKYRGHLVGVNAEEYPIFPTSLSESFLSVEANILKEMIDKTIFSVSNDETRYHLNGVYFEMIPKVGLRMVATDGHRLSLITKEIQKKTISLHQGVIIPRKGLFEIKKILENTEGNVEIAVEGSQFILRSGYLNLMIRLIEGKYPNYQLFIPQQLDQKFSVDRELFLASLKKVSMMAQEKSKAVLFSLTNGKMEISSSNPDLGDAKDEIEIDYGGADLKIGFNARYIQDILANINQTKVQFEFKDHISPGLMKPFEDQQYTCVVMPMRI